MPQQCSPRRGWVPGKETLNTGQVLHLGSSSSLLPAWCLGDSSPLGPPPGAVLNQGGAAGSWRGCIFTGDVSRGTNPLPPRRPGPPAGGAPCRRVPEGSTAPCPGSGWLSPGGCSWLGGTPASQWAHAGSCRRTRGTRRRVPGAQLGADCGQVLHAEQHLRRREPGAMAVQGHGCPHASPGAEGCADCVQLGLGVLQGYVRGDLEPRSGELEEVQHRQLDLPQQQGLLGGCVLDAGPVGLLGTE